MFNCVAGIGGSILIGKYLDKLKCFKTFQIWIAFFVALSIAMTAVLLHLDAPNVAVIVVAVLACVKLTTALTDETPSHINYMYGFILWCALPLIGLIPAFAVEEDLRRLNMKDV